MQSELEKKIGQSQAEFLDKMWKLFERRKKNDIDPNLPINEKKALLSEFEKRLDNSIEEKKRIIMRYDDEIQKFEEAIVLLKKITEK